MPILLMDTLSSPNTPSNHDRDDQPSWQPGPWPTHRNVQNQSSGDNASTEEPEFGFPPANSSASTTIGGTAGDDSGLSLGFSSAAGVGGEDDKKSIWHRISLLFTSITIEPMLFCQMTGLSLSTVNIQNLYIRNICYQLYANQTAICADLKSHKVAEYHVDGVASTFTTYRNIIECLVPVFFAMFLGSWTDKHGCKIPLVLSLTGYTLSALIYTFFTIIPTKVVDPRILLLASVPLAFSGGLIALILSAFKYVASVTTLESRSFRIAIAEGIWFSGVPIGLYYGAKMVQIGGYQAIFTSAAILYAIGCLYVLVVVREDQVAERNCGAMLNDMFNFESVRDTVVTCFRKRSGSKRLWIVLLLITICIRILTLFGSMNISYLYTRARFGWDIGDFSTYGIVDALLGVFGGALMTIIGMKMLNISDTIIGLVSSISYLGGSIIWSIAWTGTIMYIGAFVQMFCGMITIVIRSMLSKMVPRDELGKIYSFLACGEAIMPVIAAPLFNTLFKNTVNSFTPAVYLLCAGFNSVIVICFLYFYISKRHEPFQELDEDQDGQQQHEPNEYERSTEAFA